MDPDYIKMRIANWAAERRRYSICEEIVGRIGNRLSSEAIFSPTCWISITVNTREDLAIIMEIAPLWKKEARTDGIAYKAKYCDEEIELVAIGDALPGTCKLVEEEYDIPAKPAQGAIPATKGKRMVLKCDHAEKPEELAQAQAT